MDGEVYPSRDQSWTESRTESHSNQIKPLEGMWGLYRIARSSGLSRAKPTPRFACPSKEGICRDSVPWHAQLVRGHHRSGR